jgi:hypothetical protein
MKKRGRPKGATSKFPTYTKIHDALLEHGVDPIKELADHYNESKALGERALALQALKLMLEFGFAKPRPVDQKGEAENPTTINITNVPDADLDSEIKRLVKLAGVK